MEVKGPIDHFTILEIAGNTARVQVLTFEGEEYELRLGAGDCVRAAIPDDRFADYPPDSLPAEPPDNAMESEGAGADAASILMQPGLTPPGLMPPAAARRNRLLEELEKLEPRLRVINCDHCGHPERLAITQEGIVSLCRHCGRGRRIDAELLQQLADKLDIRCFACGSGSLKSEATDYANILQCRNPACGSNNSWRGVSDRMLS